MADPAKVFTSWDDFFALDVTEIPADFMTDTDRNQGEHGPDPFQSDVA